MDRLNAGVVICGDACKCCGSDDLLYTANPKEFYCCKCGAIIDEEGREVDCGDVDNN